MKYKFTLIIMIFLITISSSKVAALENVELVNCTSFSNIWISSNGEIKRIHLIGVEKPIGVLDNEINSYVCETLKNAKNITMEYENNKTDKYNRSFVNIYIDDKLFQSDLISKGYGIVDNISNYNKHSKTLCNLENEAITSKRGIWTYPNVQDTFCKNSVSTSKEELSSSNKKENQKKFDIKYMILINSGILLLLIFMKRD